MLALRALSTTEQLHYALKFAETESDLCCPAMTATQLAAMAAAAPVKYKTDISASEDRLAPKTTAADRLPRY